MLFSCTKKPTPQSLNAVLIPIRKICLNLSYRLSKTSQNQKLLGCTLKSASADGNKGASSKKSSLNFLTSLALEGSNVELKLVDINPLRSIKIRLDRQMSGMLKSPAPVLDQIAWLVFCRRHKVY